MQGRNGPDGRGWIVKSGARLTSHEEWDDRRYHLHQGPRSLYAYPHTYISLSIFARCSSIGPRLQKECAPCNTHLLEVITSKPLRHSRSSPKVPAPCQRNETLPMSTSTIDRIVKGAPPPNVSPEQVASAARRSSTASVTAPHPPPSSANDPTFHLPSSPAQIYLNLLILEANLRAQYLSLRARLRLHLLLMAALALWTLTFTYLLFLRPREDGKGTGGSPYWVVDMGEKVGWVGGVVTGSLVWGTGMYERGVRWPRRWVGVTNRGLRGFNLKVVVMRGPWWREALGYLSLLDPLGWWPTGEVKGMRFEFMPRDIENTISGAEKEKDKLRRWEDGGKEGWIEEDVAPGGDVIKLLLLPKPFSPDFREEWDTFRTNYWDKENERRAKLRKLANARNREIAKQEGGWLWWTGWRGWKNLRGSKKADLEMTHKLVKEKGSSSHLRERRKKEGHFRESSHSRSSSRSSSITPEPESRSGRRPDDLSRRGSSQGMTRKKRMSNAASNKPSPLSSTDSRPTTPSSPLQAMSTSQTPSLSKRASNLSVSSSSDSDVKKEDTPTPPPDVKIKQEDNT
ncbi:Nem1-Spo7 phosphatase regulatory subunit [Zalaria obscura]|uniref:Nem1-Spo7 phosphatase regulatory subunit n=1 Tax=Zalaria obscura TaxID=2024903 RepID=A0ACC3SJM0_9PEZI